MSDVHSTPGASPSTSLLYQRVCQTMSSCLKRGAPRPSEEDVIRTLKQLHKEYRKAANDKAFKSRVAKAMVEFDEANQQQQPSSQSSEAKAEEAATQVATTSTTVTPSAGQQLKRQRLNALSASLTSSYKSQNGGGDNKDGDSNQKSNSRGSNPTSTSNAIRKITNRPTVRYSDVGGLEPHLQEIRELCEYPLRHPEIYSHLRITPPRGVLLHGPPGCGKTLLAHAIAGELGASFFKIAAPEIVSGMSGESEEKVRTLFQDAAANAPSIIFIDEIDAITSKRETNARGMELRIVAQLLTCMDGLCEGMEGVLVIGATNRPDALDPALRRAGRFDREICLGIPDQEGRERVLRVLVSKMRVAGDFDFKLIAKLTPGFVGADLAALTREAAVVTINRIFAQLATLSASKPQESASATTNLDVRAAALDDEMARFESRVAASDQLRLMTEPLTPEQLEPLKVEMSDFLIALPKVQPSSKREGFATVPSVTWDDVGALADAREELNLAITEPIRRPERFRDMGLTVPAGVLLFGPPGCGKSLLAKAIANSSGANFISIKGPELLNKYVGESERAVRQVFSRARASAPCVVFFDELDALCPRRDASGGEGNGVTERVVNQLLTEMDGLDARKSVFVIAATNRPELIDQAMLRPGRLDRLVYVPLPDASDREAILKACTRKTPLEPGLDLGTIASDPRIEGFSGADLAALVRESAVRALQRSGVLSAPEDAIIETPKVTVEDLVFALGRVAPSVSERDRKNYDRMNEQLSSVRARQQKQHQQQQQSRGNGDTSGTNIKSQKRQQD